MIKKMCCLGSSIIGVIVLSACGSTTPVALDKSILSKCDSNAMSPGGYWWTYTDHNDLSTDIKSAPFHSTISQLTSAKVGLQTTPDADPKYGNVCKVEGTVPAALPWADVSAIPQASYTIDPHWAAVYAGPTPPAATVPDYPSAGIGFGYQHFNKPYDATGGGQYVGIIFDMKPTKDMTTVWVTMPIVGTDLPDPSVGITDDFPAPGQPGGCTYYTAETGKTPGTGGMSCFTSYRYGIKSAAAGGGPFNTLAAVNTWQHYCVLFTEVQPPNWANAASLAMIPKFDPTQALKVQWDFFQPAAGGTAAEFGIALDNVKLITSTEAKESSNNCDQARLDDPLGSGDAG